ncbi:hypothetical protein DFJ73DRAFT_223436 [Zopfochytrium polystomum]|nr:hypothetical protein DFJ73DRAFT_223436 [Zopfochytrium polystomum]
MSTRQTAFAGSGVVARRRKFAEFVEACDEVDDHDEKTHCQQGQSGDDDTPSGKSSGNNVDSVDDPDTAGNTPNRTFQTTFATDSHLGLDDHDGRETAMIEEGDPSVGKVSGDNFDDPLLMILVDDPAVPFALHASAFQAFPGTYLARRTAAAAPTTTTTSLSTPTFPFAKPFEIWLPDCPVAVFTRVVLPFYGIEEYVDGDNEFSESVASDYLGSDRSKRIKRAVSARHSANVTTMKDWTVPGFNSRSDVPYSLHRSEEDVLMAALAGGLMDQKCALSNVHVDGEDDTDELLDVSSALIDRCLKFLLIPSPYDVPHALRFYTAVNEFPALDRMLRVVQQQAQAHQTLLGWHAKRTATLRKVDSGGTLSMPEVLVSEVAQHFRLHGLKREVGRLKQDAWGYERPKMDELYFAPQACKATDVEFRSAEARKLIAAFSRHGLLDKMYFRRFDMGVNNVIHASSCFAARNSRTVYMKSITPKLGSFVLPDKLVVVGDVDDLPAPPEGAKVYRSEDLKRVPMGVLLVHLMDEKPYVCSSDWVSKTEYNTTEEFDWPLTSEGCWESSDCPAAGPTKWRLGIVFWNGYVL